MRVRKEMSDSALKRAGEIRDIRATIQGLKEGTLRPTDDVSDDEIRLRTRLVLEIKRHGGNPFIIADEANKDKVMWENLKEERNALIAMIIDKVYERMKPMIPELMKQALVSAKGEEFVATFRKELDAYFSRVDSLSDNTPLAQLLREREGDSLDFVALARERKLLDRYRLIVDFGVAADLWNFGGFMGFHSQFIMRGMRTADETMRNFMVMIPTILRREGIPDTGENIEKAARASMPFLLQIASMNLMHGVPVMNAIKRGTTGNKHAKRGFHDRFFELNKDTLRIFMPRKTLGRLRGDVRVLFQKILDLSPDGVTTKCPASYSMEFFMTIFEYYLTSFLSVAYDNELIERDAIARMKQ